MPRGMVIAVLDCGCLVMWDPPRRVPVLAVRVVARPIDGVPLVLRSIGEWTVAIAQADVGVVGVWDLIAKQLIREIEIGGRIVAFDAAPSYFVAAMEGGAVVRCAAEGGEIVEMGSVGDIAEIRCEDATIWVRNNRNEWFVRTEDDWQTAGVGRFFAGGGKFARIQGADVKIVRGDGKVVGEFCAHGSVTAFEMHPTQPFAVVGTEDGWIDIVELNSFVNIE
jgi:hypothetical protein